MTDDINKTFALLRQRYPADIELIEAEEERVSKLLKAQEFAQQDTTKELIHLCRKDIVFARTQLATDRKLSEEERAALWGIVDARQWFLQMVVKDYDAELASVAAQLRADLER